MSRSLRTAAVVFLVVVLSLTAAFLPACEQEDFESDPPVSRDTPFTVYVGGYEWGPGAYKVKFDFGDVVSGADAGTFVLRMWSSNRSSRTTVWDAYPCDVKGERVEEPSRYVAFEIEPKRNDASMFKTSPSGRSVWNDEWSVTLELAEGESFSVGEESCSAGAEWEHVFAAAERVIPATEAFEKDTFTHGDVTLTRALFTPEGAESDGKADPLVIWLHGGGEGGTDIDIALLGAEVTALTREDEIGYWFADDGVAGAYVLAVQCPTMWMDSGDGTIDNEADGEQTSVYTDALIAAIEDVVDSEPDIDRDRIYVGGCSNGGYMTMNLAFEMPDYFAAFYPVCEGYNDANISDEMIEAIKDESIWFVYSVNDYVLPPDENTVPTYARLLLAGAEDVHCTVLDKVAGYDDPTITDYGGHWVWTTVLNDRVESRLDDDEVREYLATHDDTFVISPDSCTVSESLWEWLSERVG